MFDGDTLNILSIINKEFAEAMRIFNPAESMIISRNDSYVNSEILPNRDLLINGSALIYLSREFYKKEYLKEIENLKNDS